MIDQFLNSPEGQELRSFAKDIGEWTKAKVEKVAIEGRMQSANRFFEWSQQNMVDTEIKEWIAELSNEGVEAITFQLTRFFSDFDLELRWLFDEEYPAPNELSINLREMAENYCRACRFAVECQDDAKKFARTRHLNRLRSTD